MMVRFALVGFAAAVLIPAAALGQDKQQNGRGKMEKEKEQEKEKSKEKQEGKDTNQGDKLPLRVVEGRVLRITESEGILTLTLLVEGRRVEFLVPERLEEEVRQLRTGYLVGVGYGTEQEVHYLRWVFLILGGKEDRREEWAKKRAANKEEWEKAEREEQARKEKEEKQRHKHEEEEEEEEEEKEKKGKEKEGEKEKRNK